MQRVLQLLPQLLTFPARVLAAAADGRFGRGALIIGAAALLLTGCEGQPVAPDIVSDPSITPSLGPTIGVDHRLMVHLELADLADARSLPALTAGFNAFVYGHQGAYEDAVRGLQRRGLESFRYYNVFHTDPLYPRWGGYYGGLHKFLFGIDGWIRGVSYRYYSNPQDPDRIIDHTRSIVTTGVVERITSSARSTATDKVFLDVTFDELADWMISPGERWPWSASAHEQMNRRWRLNMQGLVDQVATEFPVMINGSVKLRAGSVLYENQVWNHRRGWSRWEEVVRRMVAHETIPALSVGHHLLRSSEIAQAENMTLAVWLLADQSYLAVQAEGRPLAWAREIQRRGLARFTPTGPAAQVRPGVWRRLGRIGQERWVVEVDIPREVGRVERQR